MPLGLCFAGLSQGPMPPAPSPAQSPLFARQKVLPELHPDPNASWLFRFRTSLRMRKAGYPPTVLWGSMRICSSIVQFVARLASSALVHLSDFETIHPVTHSG